MAIAWGQPLEYIESLSPKVMTEFKALNLIAPFTSEAEAYRQGLIATLIYNKGCSKKSQTKSVQDLFPYMNPDTPDFLEDEKVKKAKSILKSVSLQRNKPELYKQSLDEVISKIKEEISIEVNKRDPDIYLIQALKKLIGEHDGKDV